MSKVIERYRLERLVRELKSKRGRGTELISLYIPAGRPISDVMSVLREEYSTATNIKDRTTRHHVLDALTAIMQRLKFFRKTPENGLIVFAGYIATDVPGSEEMEIHLIEPPEKLRAYLYRCNSRFHTEILEEMISKRDVYGLIVIDRNEAAIGILKGKSIEILKVLTSGIPGKHRAGGQSARRFERIIEQLAHEFYKRVGEYSTKYFLEIKELKGIIIGGPGPTKHEFTKGDYLHYTLKAKVLAVLDIGYSGETGIYELARVCTKVLKDAEYARERELVRRFLYEIARDTGLAIYGEEEIRKALFQGAVSVLLISEDLEAYRVKYTCPNCSFTLEKTIRNKDKKIDIVCPKCGEKMKVIEKKELIEELIELAKNVGTDVELISTETEEGEELRRSFGGLGAILRFKVEIR
ncbi:MAG: peptide chain release factor 1 [Thermofilum sp. ex4484_79]|nr:MAG: peptide chain release factor 1 [Thermofilum sp. ex4484_79]HDD63686.1 peptide chain release factor 1 [Thermoprotei archaeon]